jgi:hypothetical protein
VVVKSHAPSFHVLPASASHSFLPPKGFLRTCQIAMALGAFLIAEAHGGEMVLAGTHPTSPSTAFPAIHVLKAFEDRIYMGYGNWNLYPAVSVVSYHPATATFHPEHSPGSDSVGQFRVIGDDLFVPSIDPVHYEEFVDFSVRSGGVWRRHTPGGFLHVFDMGTRTGEDLWFVGAKMRSESPTPGAAVWRSGDGGKTWSDVTLATALSRYYYCFTLRGRFYVHDTVYDDSGPTRIPAAPYLLLYKPLNIGSGEDESVVGIAQLTPGAGGFSRQTLVSFDGVEWRALKTNVLDLTVNGTLLYTLDYNTNSALNELWVADASAGNPLAWARLPISNVPANAKAVEVLGDSIYVGDTGGQLWVAKLDGNTPAVPPSTIANELPDGFGRAVASDGKTLVIGAPEFSGASVMSGRVVVWTRSDSGSGASSWEQSQVLDSPHPMFSGWFGKDVAVENHIMAVLEAGHDPTGTHRGAAARVHLYESTLEGWQPRQILTNDHAHSFLLKSNVLWVGASRMLHRYSIEQGANGIAATLVETVSSSVPSAMYQPTARVAGDDQRVAFGNAGDFSRTGGPGQVNVYERDDAVWRRISILRQTEPPLPEGLTYHPDGFGFAVALAGDWLAVGAPRDDTAAWQAGAVYLYQRSVVGITISYVMRQKIVAPVSQQDAGFGSSIAFDGEYLVIGCPGYDSEASRREGRVYVYRLTGTNAVSVGESWGDFPSCVRGDRKRIGGIRLGGLQRSWGGSGNSSQHHALEHPWC